MKSNEDSFAEAIDDQRKDVLHRIVDQINRVLSIDQHTKIVSHDTKVADALDIMKAENFSQLPVEANGKIVGIFSFRSFSNGLVHVSLKQLNAQRTELSDLHVSEFLEQPDYFRVTASIGDVFEALDAHDCVLVGEEEKLAGILTSTDFVRYLYDVASPFVLLTEIELGLRAIIEKVMNETEIARVAESIGSLNREGHTLPNDLGRMTMSHYITLITWDKCYRTYFQGVFGFKLAFKEKFENVRLLRNDIFHFRKFDLNVYELNQLIEARDYIFSRIEIASSSTYRGVSDD